MRPGFALAWTGEGARPHASSFPVKLVLTQARPTQARPTQARPTQARPTQARPTQARPTQARPTRAYPHISSFLHEQEHSLFDLNEFADWLRCGNRRRGMLRGAPSVEDGNLMYA
jgi:hypothetical protein